MMNSSKTLNDIFQQVSYMYIESKNSNLTFEKKYEYYSRSAALINEADKIIEELKDQIVKLDSSKINLPSHTTTKIEYFIELLTTNRLKFTEILSIINHLFALFDNIPTKTQIFDNIEKELLLEQPMNNYE